MTRLAIAADLHVDDFGSKVLPSGLNARFVDALEAVSFIGRTAVERGAAALVIAGDYSESKNPSPPRVARIIERLQDGPARQIHVRGNHDSERAGKSIVDVLGQIEGWGGYTQPGLELVDDVAVCVIPFLSASYLRAQPGLEQAPASEVYRLLGEAYLTIARGLFVDALERGAKSAILVGHQQLAGGRMTDAQASFLGDLDVVIDSRALASIGYAAVIFGHVHRAQAVIDDPACPVLFAGSAHRVDFAEANEEKSFVLVDVVDGKASIELVPIPARRFVTIDFDAPGWGEALTGIQDAVVRVLNVEPDRDAAELRGDLESSGAFEVAEIRPRPSERPDVAGRIAEGLSAHQALAAYFADDADADALVERGREILDEAAA